MNPAGILQGVAPLCSHLGWGAGAPGRPCARADEALPGAASVCMQAGLDGLQMARPC